MSDLVGNPEDRFSQKDRFSQNEAYIFLNLIILLYSPLYLSKMRVHEMPLNDVDRMANTVDHDQTTE